MGGGGRLWGGAAKGRRGHRGEGGSQQELLCGVSSPVRESGGGGVKIWGGFKVGGGGGERGGPQNWGGVPPQRGESSQNPTPPPQVMNMYGDLVMDAVPDKVRGGQGGGAAL